MTAAWLTRGPGGWTEPRPADCVCGSRRALVGWTACDCGGGPTILGHRTWECRDCGHRTLVGCRKAPLGPGRPARA